MAIFLENARLYDDLNAMFLGTLEALTASIDAKDRYTCGHSRRVALLTRQLAHAAGLDEATIKAWSVDPQVTLDADGAKGSIFDALEDLDVDACIEKCVAINKCK